MNCKNCEATLDGKFCTHCGQKGDTHRITIGHLLHEFTHALTHADKGFLLLIKDLLRKPGVVAREYLEGKRKKYFNPFSFLVIMTAASAFISYQTGYLSEAGRGNANASEYYSEARDISVKYGKLIGLILIVPLYSLLSWLFFWKPKYNLAEHVVLQSYGIGMYYLFSSVIFIPLFLIIPGTFNINNTVLHVLYAIYMGFAYRQFFQKNLFVSILKSFLTIIVFIILFWYLLVGYVWLKHLIVS
jgi:hypothetical protein